MHLKNDLFRVGVLLVLTACRDRHGEPSGSVPAAPAPAASSPSSPQRATESVASSASTPQPAAVSKVSPTRLLALPVSAYAASLALDGDSVLVFTSDAAYRVAPGQDAARAKLDLGFGPVLTEGGIVFWAKDAIWNASKESGALSRLAPSPRKPAYFVTSSAGLAWLERTEDERFAIQSLNGNRTRPLVIERDPLSALTMIRDAVYFVRAAEDKSWRIGRVGVGGGVVAYSDSRTGPIPASLTGTENVVYYDMGRSEIRQLMPDLKSEQVLSKNFVCSPIHEAIDIYCGCVEGLFVLGRGDRRPRILSAGGGPITFIQADSKQVAWIVDVGRNRMAVDWLSAQ